MSALSLAWMDLRKLFRSSKLYVLIFLTWFFINDFARPIRQTAESLGVGIAPYLYPIFLSSWSYRLYLLLGIVLLLSDAPFKDEVQLSVLIRSGRKRWLYGKLLYLLLGTFLYQFIYFLLSIVVLFPRLGISLEWGDALISYAVSEAQAAASTGTVGGALYIVQNYPPLLALFFSLVLCSCLSFVLGLFIFLINDLSHSKLGVVLTLIVGCADIFFDSLRWAGYYIKFPLVVSWVDLGKIYINEYDESKQSIYSILFWFFIIGAVCIILLNNLYKHRVLEVTENK